jgi:hypothetical protein
MLKMSQDRFLDCPECGAHGIDKIKISISMFRFFSYPKCQKCGVKYYVGKSWQENFFGVFFVLICASAYLAQKCNNYIFYLMPILWMIVGGVLAYFFAKPVQIGK